MYRTIGVSSCSRLTTQGVKEPNALCVVYCKIIEFNVREFFLNQLNVRAKNDLINR